MTDRKKRIVSNLLSLAVGVGIGAGVSRVIDVMQADPLRGGG